MTEFGYKAKSTSGEEKKGNIEANDQHSAAILLRKKGLIVISIEPKGLPASRFLNKFLNKVSFTTLVIITRQLATMVSSGLVLSEGIDILEEQQTNKTLKKALSEVSQDVKGGLTLGQALGKHQDIFPALYVNLVKSGEESGKLDQVLLQMADNLEKEREFQSRIKGALIYPIIVITLMIVVVIVMMVVVVPRLTELYDQSQVSLPLPTRILIGVSGFMLNFWWVGLTLLVIFGLMLNRWRHTEEGDYFLSRLLLRMPIVGRIIVSTTLTNLTRTFGLLISAGIPLLDAISTVSSLTNNKVFKNALKDAYAGVEKGLPLSLLLASDVFPKILGQMVKVGEETGKVDEIFFKLSQYFESESDHLIKNLTVAIEPIIFIILGIGVAFLAISILLPIYQITTKI